MQEESILSRRTFCLAGVVAGVVSAGALVGCAASDSVEQKAPEGEPAQGAMAEGGATIGEQRPADQKLYIVDTVKPKPGDGKAFLDDYMDTYVPIAQKAGMVLVSAMVAPPLWIDTDSNTVQVVWTVDDIAQAAWAMNSATRYDPDYVTWWGSVRSRVVARDRSYYASEPYMEVLNNV